MQKSKAQATAESRGADLSTVQDDNARLEQQNDRLSAENSSLRAQPPADPTAGESSSAADGSSTLLSELTPLNTNAVNSPRAVTIGTQVYPDSFTLGCSTRGLSVTYPVA